MEVINLLVEYVYVPLLLLCSYIYTEQLKIKVKLEDYSQMKEDLHNIKIDLHHLVELAKESRDK